MARILFYAPFNQRSRDTESLMMAFQEQGHHVMCLSQQEGNQINDFLNSNGVEATSYVVPGRRSGPWYFARHLIFFIRYCWKKKPEIVYSHLEPANFVAAIGQYFIRGATYLCRHHIDEGNLYKFDRDLYYRLTYFLAKKIVVVSEHAKRYMIDREGIAENKIVHINLGYNFKLYPKPDLQRVKEIRARFSADLLLLSACRFTKFKRPDLSVEVVKKLRTRGINAKLILLGKGELQEELESQIDSADLKSAIYMPGYVDNILDYMTATDYFLHPSILESSCVVIKEAGLSKTPVIVCRGVGDFNDYIVGNVNGFLVDKDNYVEESVETILQTRHDAEKLKVIGENLNRSVLELFSVENVIEKYDVLNKA